MTRSLRSSLAAAAASLLLVVAASVGGLAGCVDSAPAAAPAALTCDTSRCGEQCAPCPVGAPGCADAGPVLLCGDAGTCEPTVPMCSASAAAR